MKTTCFILLAVTATTLAHLEPSSTVDGTFDNVVEGTPLQVETPDIRTVTDFYPHLAPHGRWVQVQPYGLVWQPNVSVTVASWHPYCDEGSWAWTDRGWYWDSRYSWGWAPFHYGRWHLSSDRGWFWVPDTVWSPAWVHWRYSDSHFGWAPLPPGATFQMGVGLHFGGGPASIDCHFGLTPSHYSFVERRHFLSTDLRLLATSRHSYANICAGSTVIRHGLGYSGSHIVHHGLPFATVGSACRRNVQLHQIVRHQPVTTTVVRPSYSHTTYQVPSYQRPHTVVTRPTSVYHSTAYHRPSYSSRPHYSHGGSSRQTTVVQTPTRLSQHSTTRPTYSQPSPSPSRSVSSSSGSSRPSTRTTVSSNASRRSDRMKHIVKRR